MIWQFSTPIREVEQALKRGRAHLRFTAARAINLTDAEAKPLIDRIQAAIVRFANSKGKDTQI
jgi:hypothetical protein